MYFLNKVAECKLSTEKLYIAPATTTLYQKKYRLDLSATLCSVKVHIFRYNCGMFSHTSYVHDQNSITYGMMVTPEKCILASKSKKNEITSFDKNLDEPIEFDVKTQSKFNDGQTSSSTVEYTSGQVRQYAFETLLQRVNLTYIYGIKEVSNRVRKKIPCLSREGGCETTAFESFAYTWDSPEKYVMTKILTQDAKMLHYPLTTARKVNQFFFLREFNNTGKRTNIKPKVFRESYELNGKSEKVYKTNFESLFVKYQRSFAMPVGELQQRNIHLTHSSFRLTTLIRCL